MFGGTGEDDSSKTNSAMTMDATHGDDYGRRRDGEDTMKAVIRTPCVVATATTPWRGENGKDWMDGGDHNDWMDGGADRHHALRW